MQRHPILRKPLAIDLGSRDRYFWQSLPISPTLPPDMVPPKRRRR